MISKKETAILLKKYKKQAENSEWCDLADSIITLEKRISKEKKAKPLKILNLKLEIFEKEKASRVFNSFDMQYFISKEYEGFEPGYS